MLDGTRTPPELFAALDAEYAFAVDLFATRENAKCPLYFSPQIDAFNVSWPAKDGAKDGNGWLFANPPYSRGKVALFVMKAIEEAKRGAGIVAVLPCTPGVDWFNSRILRPCDTVEGFTVDHPGVVYSSGAPVWSGYCLSMVGIGYRQKVTFLRGRVPFLAPVGWPNDRPWNPPSFDSILWEVSPPRR